MLLISMRLFLGLALLLLVLAGGFFLLKGEKVFTIVQLDSRPGDYIQAKEVVLSSPEAELPLLDERVSGTTNKNGDIKNQEPLTSPPEVIKAIYATGWSAGSVKKIDYLIKMIETTELNAIVVDIKDYSGHVSYFINHPLLRASGALDEPRILKPNALIKKLHDHGIYVIGRISVFQDPVLAKAHPEWAVHVSSTGQVWQDRKGLSWMDPAAREVWDYNLAIARDAFTRGFDEVNFDYVRFPSDGSLKEMTFPFFKKEMTMASVIEDFFKYLRVNLPQDRLSVDLFGLATIEKGDLGIGQVLEKAFPYFDYIAPMVYPSHYASGIMGFRNPADHPFEVVKTSVAEAIKRLLEYNTNQLEGSSTPRVALRPRAKVKIRPWLQDFDLGAVYDAPKIRDQIRASDESGGVGWMLWDPKNDYTEGALLPK